jgi:hypothetical protein
LKRIVQELRDFSRVFYDENKSRLSSIYLVGSLARSRPQDNIKSTDVDICLVSKSYYDLFIKSPSPEINAGVYPVWRLTSGLDKSHHMYDLKNNSMLLAGEDLRPLIPEITIEDFYPLEGFLFLLNRSIDLLRVIECVSVKGITVNKELLKSAISRIKRAYLDSYLVFRKQYCPDYDIRVQMFTSLGNHLPNLETFEDARVLLLDGFDEGLKITKISTCGHLINLIESRYQYPINFRIFTSIMTRKPRAIFHNPLLNTYKQAIRFLRFEDMRPRDWDEFKADLIRTFNYSPQPALVKRNLLLTN